MAIRVKSAAVELQKTEKERSSVMKKGSIFDRNLFNGLRVGGVALLMMFALSLPAHGADMTSATPMPAAVFPDRVYTFDPVAEGTDVTHDFIVENHGGADLKILKVKPG